MGKYKLSAEVTSKLAAIRALANEIDRLLPQHKEALNSRAIHKLRHAVIDEALGAPRNKADKAWASRAPHISRTLRDITTAQSSVRTAARRLAEALEAAEFWAGQLAVHPETGKPMSRDEWGE